MYRMNGSDVEIFLCRPFSIDQKNTMRWGIPKGKIDPGEDPEDAAVREFFEETGLLPPNVPKFYLGKIMYPSGKKEVSVWAFEFEPPTSFKFKSNYTKVKDRFGKNILIPEIGDWSWFNLEDAHKHIMVSQKEILSRFLRFMGKNKTTYGKESNDEVNREGTGKDRLQRVSKFGEANR
jgi:predicted NUDIX family NTP pyrophosphohydrolase